MKPLSPNEIVIKKATSIPEFVIEAVNNVLAKEYNGSQAILLQEDIINEILRIYNSTRHDDISREHIFKSGWLDFEGLFSQAGWNVEYDKPGYNETYPPRFTFTPKF
jgi:hypothetical protein